MLYLIHARPERAVREEKLLLIDSCLIDWKAALDKKDCDGGLLIIDKLEDLNLVHDELQATRAPWQFNTKLVAFTACEPLHLAMARLRQKWKCAYKLRDSMRLLVDGMKEHCCLSEDDVITIENGLCQAGVESMDDLDSAPSGIIDLVPQHLRFQASEVIREVTRKGDIKVDVLLRPLLIKCGFIVFCTYQVAIARTKPMTQGQRVFDIIENGITCPKASELPGGRADVLKAMKENARIFVVWTSILPSTRQSYKTHVRSWLRFRLETLGKESDQFLIELEEITLWCCNFTNVGTLKNYLAGLHWSCDLLGVPTAVFADPLIRL